MTRFLLITLLVAACDEPVVERALDTCDPEIAAAEIFADSPADIPDEFARATCDVASGPRKCTVSGDKETCCGPVYCCTNDSTGNTYMCRRRIKIVHDDHAHL